MPGAKPGERRGGRQKGIRNKRTAEKLAAIEASGETPMDYMLRIMRDPHVGHERRDRMAGQVAPYVHPKLTQIQGDKDKPLTVVSKIERIIVDPLIEDRDT